MTRSKPQRRSSINKIWNESRISNNCHRENNISFFFSVSPPFVPSGTVNLSYLSGVRIFVSLEKIFRFFIISVLRLSGIFRYCFYVSIIILLVGTLDFSCSFIFGVIFVSWFFYLAQSVPIFSFSLFFFISSRTFRSFFRDHFVWAWNDPHRYGNFLKKRDVTILLSPDGTGGGKEQRRRAYNRFLGPL